MEDHLTDFALSFLNQNGTGTQPRTTHHAPPRTDIARLMKMAMNDEQKPSFTSRLIAPSTQVAALGEYD
jgi:hypothetical protein